MADQEELYHMNRGADAKFLPHDFWQILFNSYFPVVALTYIGALLGIALREINSFQAMVHYLLQDDYAYNMALWVVLWTSFPAIFWIIIRSSMRFAHTADKWYRGLSAIMIVSMLLMMIVFPSWETGQGMQVFFVATMPVFFIQYYFFVRGGLPPLAAWPLTVAGLSLMIYGIVT